MELLKFFRSFAIKVLKDQRGEVGDLNPDDLEEKEEGVFSPDELDLKLEEEKDESGKGAEKDKEKEEKEEKDKKKDEESDTKSDDERLTALEEGNKVLEQKNKNLNKALHEERQKKKTPKADDKPLPEAELRRLHKEAIEGEDAETSFNVMMYLAEQAAKGKSVDTVNEKEIAQQAKKLDGFLSDKFPTIHEAGSTLRNAVNHWKDELNMDDHPYGDFVGTAVAHLMNLPAIIKNAREEGKKEALKDKSEELREAKIKDNLLPGSKGKQKEKKELSKSANEAADQLELTTSQREIMKKLKAGKEV